MITLIVGSLILSVLHALIPNHWLPVLAVGRREKWSLSETSMVTFISGLSHAISTVAIGIGIGLVGIKLSESIRNFSGSITPAILVILGLFYIYQHHRHKHFHLHPETHKISRNKIIFSLVIAMFFSPCFEIEAYFLLAGAYGWQQVILLSLLYTMVTVIGMVMWVRITYRGLLKLNWHTLEHNSGIITGVTLVLTGVISFFIH